MSIDKRIKSIDPIKYASTRNYGDGAVSYLSPYISRGVISTKQVYEHINSLEMPWVDSEKFIMELAWRDYWQQVWKAKKDEINHDLKNQQEPIENYKIPKAIVNATTGIEVIDKGIEQLYKTGYMHNHMRMYVASICCNIANSHWLEPAKWMYSNLLDGDIASNNLSWQWVAGSFSNKKYFANQDNINNFFNSNQKNTFLDKEYDEFESLSIPSELTDFFAFNTITELPKSDDPSNIHNEETLIYNYYNLDPYWHSKEKVQRIFLLEPSFYSKYPVGKKCIDFAIELSQNIDGIKVFVGEFSELNKLINSSNITFKEHPINSRYQGKEEPRDWLSNVSGYYPSFFAFWKKCKKELMK